MHRDVKTENMLLDKTRTVKIADFGVARLEASNPSDMTGETGTLGYMAPEVSFLEHWLFDSSCCPRVAMMIPFCITKILFLHHAVVYLSDLESTLFVYAYMHISMCLTLASECAGS